MRARLAALALLLSWLGSGDAAWADFESWNWIEYRVPILERSEPGFPRLSLRLFTDVRFNTRSGGLAQLFLRVGPLLDVTRWLFIGCYRTI